MARVLVFLTLLNNGWAAAEPAAAAEAVPAFRRRRPRKIFGYEQDLRADASRPRWVSRDVDGQAGIKHRPALASNGPQNRRKNGSK